MRKMLGFAGLLLLLIVSILPIASIAFGQDVYVPGHIRRDGTYVQPHYQTRPDGNPYNNYSTYPNINPYTGKQGTHHYPASPYELPKSNYSSPFGSPYQRR